MSNPIIPEIFLLKNPLAASNVRIFSFPEVSFLPRKNRRSNLLTTFSPSLLQMMLQQRLTSVERKSGQAKLRPGRLLLPTKS